MSNKQLNELKPRVKHGTDVNLNVSSNLNCNSNDKTNCVHQLLLTNTQVLRIYRTFTNNSLSDIKLLKIHMYEMVQLGGFLDRLLGQFLKTGLPLIKMHLNH